MLQILRVNCTLQVGDSSLLNLRTVILEVRPASHILDSGYSWNMTCIFIVLYGLDLCLQQCGVRVWLYLQEDCLNTNFNSHNSLLYITILPLRKFDFALNGNNRHVGLSDGHASRMFKAYAKVCDVCQWHLP